MEKTKAKRVYKRKTKEVEKMEDIPEVPETKTEDTNTIKINYPMPNDTYKLVLEIEFPELKEKIMNLLNLK